MTPTAILMPSDVQDGFFGRSVAISGNTIVVGDSGFGSNAGAGYVFVKPTSGWTDATETAKLTATDGVLDDGLGTSASISGTTIALGAPQLQGISNPGKGYVFVEPAAGWSSMTQTAELTTTGVYTEAGLSIAISGDVVLAGAPNGGGYGAAYLWEKPSTGWANMTATATLTPGDVQQNNDVGWTVGTSGSIAIVGAPGRTIGTMLAEGGIYVFEEPNGGWKNASSATVLTGSDARYLSYFGSSVAIDGKVVVGGAPCYLTQGAAAYIFGLP